VIYTKLIFDTFTFYSFILMQVKLVELLPRIRTFLKQLQVLAWLEMFEKWFGFFVKIFWIGVFITFGLYLHREYKKDVYYLQDFKVPASWQDQGYTGVVVKEAIIDQIDLITNEVHGKYVKSRKINKDDPEILEDITIEGFNLRIVANTILSLFGKPKRTIKGHVVVQDTTLLMTIQMTDRLPQFVSIHRSKPIKDLIFKATLEVMKLKSPQTLMGYYYKKGNSSQEVKEIYDFMKVNRPLYNNYVFYTVASNYNGVFKNLEESEKWADSLLHYYPQSQKSYYYKGLVHFRTYYFAEKDSTTKKMSKEIFTKYLKKAIETAPSFEDNYDMRDFFKVMLAEFYYREKRYSEAIQYFEMIGTELDRLTEVQLNNLAYAYIYQKKFKEAENVLQKAILNKPESSTIWDSMAELSTIQRKDSLAVVYLQKALIAPQKSASVSVHAYQIDPRWIRLRKRKDFQLLVSHSPKLL
jgi:tetratricopeptide (TPR) repeat protein